MQVQMRQKRLQLNKLIAKTPVTEIRSDPDIECTGLDTICTTRALGDVVSLSSLLTMSAAKDKNQAFWHSLAVHGIKDAETILEMGHVLRRGSTLYAKLPECGH